MSLKKQAAAKAEMSRLPYVWAEALCDLIDDRFEKLEMKVFPPRDGIPLLAEHIRGIIEASMKETKENLVSVKKSDLIAICRAARCNALCPAYDACSGITSCLDNLKKHFGIEK
jgi:hypothetical protein